MIQNVVTYTVVLAAANADLVLLPGMTAVVQIVVEEAADVLKIPNAALRFTPPAARPERPGAARRRRRAPAPGRRLVWVPDGEGDAPSRSGRPRAEQRQRDGDGRRPARPRPAGDRRHGR